jgi:ribonuclease R
MEVPFVYRVHDYPDPEKVREFALFAKTMGIQLKTGTPAEIAASFNRLVTEAATNESVKLLLPIAIRTMAKAAYSTDNIGHYGLGFDFYTHFTSPIRRYADVLVHRILEQNLGNDTWRTDGVRLHDQCLHISLQERKAMQAERESIRYKQVEYIRKHIGDTFLGLVSGMIERGFFVELTDNKCEGMVPFHSLPEAYAIADGRLVARGMRSGSLLKIGELVRVRILSADLERRQIEMELVSTEMPHKKNNGNR